MSDSRMAGIAGLVFVVGIFVAGVMAPLPPGVDEDASEFLEYYTDERSMLLAQAILNVAIILPALLFIGGLWTLFRAREGNVLGLAAVFGFVMGGAIATLCGAAFGALAWLGDGHGLQEDTAKELTLLAMVVNQGALVPIGAIGLASGWLILRERMLPVWVGWLGLLTGIATVAGVFGVAGDGAFAPFGPVVFAGFIASTLYSVVVAIFMIRETAPSTATAPRSAMAAPGA